eukprot:5017214-Pyramimonas_sp.AAC.1
MVATRHAGDAIARCSVRWWVWSNKVRHPWHCLAEAAHVRAKLTIVQCCCEMWTLSPLWRRNFRWHHGHGHWRAVAASASSVFGGPNGLPSLVEYGTPAGCTMAKESFSAM